MKGLRTYWLVLGAAAVFGLGLEGCGTEECNCPEGEDACVQDTTGDLPGDVIPGDSGTDSREEVAVDAALDVPSDTNVPNDFLTGTAVVKGKVTFTNMTDHSGIEVKLLIGASSDRAIAWTTTASDGSWQIDNVPATNFTVHASYGDYTLERMVTEYINVDEGATVTVADMTLTATGTASGLAVFSGFPDGIVEDNAGINVYLPARERVVQTAADGSWALDRLLPGDYLICAGYPELTGGCRTVTIEGLKTTTPPTIEITPYDVASGPANEISGVVTMAGLTDASGIKVVASGGGERIEATTDSSGSYHFTNLAPEAYSFIYSAPDGSEYEQEASFSSYPIYAGVTETIPPQVLSRGRVVAETYTNMISTYAEFTPDSKYVLYLNDMHRLLRRDLAVDDAGTGTSLIDIDVAGFVVAPDSSFVVYRQFEDARLLFTSPLDGGPRTMISWETGSRAWITTDSRWVLFSKNWAHENQSDDYWAADPTTGESHYLCDGGNTAAIWVSPDSSLIVCLDAEDRVAVVKIDDGAEIYAEEEVDGFGFKPDASTMVTCDDSTGNMTAVDLATGTTTALQGDAGWCELEVTPTAVIYLGKDEKLMSAPLDGGAPAVLSDMTLMPVDLTPDHTRVIARKKSDSYMLRYDLYSVEVTGGTPVLLATKVYGESWENNAWHTDDTGLAEYRGYLLGKNSDVIYALSDLDAEDNQIYTLHRVRLDGTKDDLVFTLTQDRWAFSVHWDVNEDLGLAVGSLADGTVGVYDLATGALKETAPSVHGAGWMSPDRTTLIRYYGDPTVIGWYRVADLTTVPLAPQPPKNHDFGDLALWPKFSPDSKHLLYFSIFGRTLSGYMDWTLQRMYVVDFE